MRVNHDKTHVTAFHLRNIEVNISLSVIEWGWSREHCSTQIFGVTLNRTLSYKQHIRNTKMKVASHNNLLMNLASVKCGTNTSTTRTTKLALYYSIANYGAPVWAISSHSDILDSELNKAWRAIIIIIIITRCLKPIYVEYLYLLAGIIPSNTRRGVYAKMEITKLMEQKPYDATAEEIRGPVTLRNDRLHWRTSQGFDSPMLTWRYRNRLRTIDTLGANNRGRNRAASMETQHVHAGWPQKTQVTCYDVLACHISAPWITFKSSMI